MPYVPKKKEVYIDMDKFKKGLYALDDTTKAPLGSFRIMQNVQITDRGGVSPRYGTQLLGKENDSSYGIKGFYNYRKSFGANEILVKAYDDELEGYSKNNTYNNFPIDDVVSYYPLDEGSGTTAKDAKGTNNGTLTNGPTYAAGKVGSNSVTFDGVDDYIDCGTGIPLAISGNSHLTIAAWAKKTDVTLNQRIAGWYGGNYKGPLLWVDGGVAKALIGQGGTSTVELTGTTSLSNAIWYHLAVTYDGATANLYVNGVLEHSAVCTSADNDGGVVFTIGCNPWDAGGCWGGSIDEVGVWDRALSLTEIASLYNSGTGLGYSEQNEWFRIKSGFTQDKEFGFINSLVNVDNQDYLIWGNRYDSMMRWSGALATTSGITYSGDSVVTVNSVLTDEIYESKTATSSAATTLDVSGTPWAASQWVNFYVYIPGTGKIRKITANTSSQITFDTLGSDPGDVPFQIRQLAFPASGTIIYNGSTIAYSGIDIATAFTVSSAHAAPTGSVVSLVPTEYPANPRGNRFANLLNRVIVGNVRSALSRDSGGTLQGSVSAGSYYVSKINNPVDFTFSGTRVAGEGDVISSPYGGGDITDVSTQEDTAYVFKKTYIESIKYSQDANDLAVRAPLKAGSGSVGKTIRGTDDIYFFTDSKQFTSIGRVKTVDILPQTDNLGYSIKTLLDTYDFSEMDGFEYKDKLYIGCKTSSSADNNDIVLIYSKQNKAFEGVWDIAASGFTPFDDKAYYAEANGANVHQLFIGAADVRGTTRLPIASNCVGHFMNLTSSKINLQALNSVYFEGYITPGSTVTFKVYKDFETSPFLQFNFSGNESGLIDGSLTGSYLGQQPLALNPLGAFSDLGADGRFHFQFRVYIPFQYANYFAVGWESSGTDLDYEITRYGLGLKEDVSVDTTSIKSI